MANKVCNSIQKKTLYRDLKTSDDERISKQILENQEIYSGGRNMYTEMERTAEQLDISLRNWEYMTKSQWKKMIKYSIRKKIEELETKVSTLKKTEIYGKNMEKKTLHRRMQQKRFSKILEDKTKHARHWNKLWQSRQV